MKLLFLLLLAGSVQAATVYRCTTPHGRAVFSDQSCGTDAQPLELPSAPLLHSDMAVSPERQKELDQQLAEQVHTQRLNHIDNAITDVRRQLDAAERERDTALRRLALYQNDTTSAGRKQARLTRLSIEKRYRDQERRLKRRLAALQKDRRQAVRY